MRSVRIAVALLAGLLLFVPAASARVVRIEILSRALVLDGKPFGASGAYEKIVGRVHFKVRPGDPRNRDIVDLDKAPRDARGEVEFSADVFILKPRDARKGNGALFLEVPNRGRRGIMTIVNGATPSPDPTAESDFGDGWFMRQGYTLATIGWQWDVIEDPTRMRLYAPVARNADGSRIVGLLRDDFSLPAKTSEVPLGHIIVGDLGGVEYPVADPDDRRNVLTVRDAVAGPRLTIPRSEWSFSRVVDGKLVADGRHLYMKSGFLPGKIYELVYVVRDPVVAGLGLAAVRDFVSHVKYDRKALVSARRAYAAGISQCGRFLRHFLWAGFNQDEAGRQVLDGVLAHVGGAGRGSFNHRFAQPSRDSQPRSALFYPTDLFPFTDLPQRDPVTGERAGLLDRAYAAKVAPKIFYSNTSYEYWGRAAALVHVSPDGRRDAPIPDEVRVYALSGLQHFSRAFPPEHGTGDLKSTHRQNPNPVRWFWRAMIANMNAWVRDGVPPPPSRHPRLVDGTLVPLARLRFPPVPGARVPRTPVRAWRLDLGPEWPSGVIGREPPGLGRPFPLLVPQVDRDGNDRGGVISPQLAVPLATYTPWNLRHPSIGAPGEMVSFLGSYLPLPRTAAERRKNRDPRPSVAERYASREQYLEKFEAAALDLVKARWLLAEDVPALMERAAEEWNQATRGP
jgi:Alpha/beta hydrolase domain